MSSSANLAPDAKAILLLCGHFGSHDNGSAKPLTRVQYNEVARCLHAHDLRPGDLLQEKGQDVLKDFEGKASPSRLRELLQRGVGMALAVEEWTSRGGWIVTRADSDYPTRFRKRLRSEAPPILYGVGDPKLLEYGGVSMVGSRDATDAALEFVRDLASRCAASGVNVVSGGARGVDRTSMEAALDAGGIVLGALANGLASTSRKKAYRNAIADRRLTLVSAYHPKSRFQVWKAMDRNKHIYALSDRAVVAHSSSGSGGTWAGATENLENGWVPMHVLAEPPIPEGNERLIEMGGHPVDRRVLQDDIDLKHWVAGSIAPCTSAEAAEDAGENQDTGPETTDETTLVGWTESVAWEKLSDESSPKLFDFIWPVLKGFLHEPKSERDVREYFEDVHLKQARTWLMEATDRGLLHREESPVRYVLPEEESDEASRATDPSSDTKVTSSDAEPGAHEASERDLFHNPP